MGEATRWSIFYVAIAVIFGVGVYAFMGSQSGTEFFAAYSSRRVCPLTTSSCSRSSSRSLLSRPYFNNNGCC